MCGRVDGRASSHITPIQKKTPTLARGLHRRLDRVPADGAEFVLGGEDGGDGQNCHAGVGGPEAAGGVPHDDVLIIVCVGVRCVSGVSMRVSIDRFTHRSTGLRYHT